MATCSIAMENDLVAGSLQDNKSPAHPSFNHRGARNAGLVTLTLTHNRLRFPTGHKLLLQLTEKKKAAP